MVNWASAVVSAFLEKSGTLFLVSQLAKMKTISTVFVRSSEKDFDRFLALRLACDRPELLTYKKTPQPERERELWHGPLNRCPHHRRVISRFMPEKVTFSSKLWIKFCLSELTQLDWGHRILNKAYLSPIQNVLHVRGEWLRRQLYSDKNPVWNTRKSLWEVFIIMTSCITQLPTRTLTIPTNPGTVTLT